MRLVRLRVEDFGAIEAAVLELGPGLNLLHGPNDLGKSTLAAAVRAALLLQTNSSAIERYRPWASGRDPSVTLTFEVDGRHWRVEKSWNASSRGHATLAWSNDGHTWNDGEEGRGVDGKLRTLLEWGVASPGGRSAPRGLPRSFVAAALLGEQALPYALFGTSLLDDSDESAKARLREALEAMASDPLYQKVLLRTQEKVDEAFTDKGKRKTGRDSIFRRATEEITHRREEAELLERRVAESEAVAARLAELHATQDRLMDERARAAERVEALERALVQAQARSEAEARLAEAERKLAELHETRAAVVELERREHETELRMPALGSELERLNVHAREARAVFQRRQQEQAVLAAGDDPEWAVERGRLEQRLARIDERAREHARLRERLAIWSARVRDLEDARTRQRRGAEVLGEIDRKIDRLRAQDHEHVRERGLAASAIAWHERRAAEQAVQQARAAVEAIARHRAESEALRREADALRSKAGATNAPEASVLERLHVLERELDVARATLGGGLAVRLDLRSDLATLVGVDEHPPRSMTQGELEVERRLTIHIEGVGAITVLAGEQQARRAFEHARGAWERAGEPVLAAAGVHELGALVSLRAEVDRSLVRAREAEREAEEHVRLAEARQPTADALPHCEEELAACERALPEDPEALAHARTLAERENVDRLRVQRDRLVRAEALLRRELEAATAERTEALLALEAENARVLAAEQRLADARAELAGERVLAEQRPSDARDPRANDPQTQLFADARAELTSDPDSLAEALARAEAALEDERRTLLATAKEHEAARERAHAGATRALTEAGRALETAERDAAAARRNADDHAAELAKLRGQLEVHRERLQTLDAAAIAEDHARSKDALAALPVPAHPVSESVLEEARAALERITAELDDAITEVRKQEGALQQVGGDVVRERAEAAREALEAAKRREAELELEYDAWRVLRDALRKAENEEGQHLGRVLGRHVGERFERLTRGRYGTLALGPELQARGLHTGTAVRELDDLSEGVKEQLATLLRISVAEHLQGALVLDDHLTQTDPQRVEWFRELLQEASRKVQIVVLTCRPADYLGSNPPSGTCVIDLEQVIRRAGV